MDAPFKRFNGRIDYDPTRPSAAKAALEVTTGSLDLGSEDYSAEVRKKNWLDAVTYPTASFISTAIRPGAAGHFDATGILTLKGKTQTLTVPVSVGKSGTLTSFDGELQISRRPRMERRRRRQGARQVSSTRVRAQSPHRIRTANMNPGDSGRVRPQVDDKK